MTSSDEDFESAVARLTDVWMHISNLQLALNCSLTGPLKSNPHAKRMHTVLEDMGVLIDESMEMADDLFLITRKTLAEFKEKNEKPPDPVEVVCSSCKQKQSALVSVDGYSAGGDFAAGEAQLQMTAGSLDEYLTLVTREPMPQPTKSWNAMEMFDLMAQKPRDQQSSRGSTTTSHKTSSTKGQLSSFATKAEPKETGNPRKSTATRSHKKKVKNKRKHRASPYAQHQPARLSQKPLGVCDWHGRTIQREYAFLYEGLSEPIWTAPRHATADELKLICEFKARSRRRKPRDGDEEVNQGNNGVKQPGKLFSVDKIVGHRMSKQGKKEYVVKWDGYDSSENTWEPAAKLRAEVPRVVEAYERGLAMLASRKANLDALTSEKAKHESQSVSGKSQPGGGSSEEAVTAARMISDEVFTYGGADDEEDEDSEIERMAASYRSDSDRSDSDASE